MLPYPFDEFVTEWNEVDREMQLSTQFTSNLFQAKKFCKATEVSLMKACSIEGIEDIEIAEVISISTGIRAEDSYQLYPFLFIFSLRFFQFDNQIFFLAYSFHLSIIAQRSIATPRYNS